MLQLKRAYESASPQDGCRVLVERLCGMVVAKEGFNIQAGAEASPLLQRLSASKNGRWLRRIRFPRDGIMDIFI